MWVYYIRNACLYTCGFMYLRSRTWFLGSHRHHTWMCSAQVQPALGVPRRHRGSSFLPEHSSSRCPRCPQGHRPEAQTKTGTGTNPGLRCRLALERPPHFPAAGNRTSFLPSWAAEGMWKGSGPPIVTGGADWPVSRVSKSGSPGAGQLESTATVSKDET